MNKTFKCDRCGKHRRQGGKITIETTGMIKYGLSFGLCYPCSYELDDFMAAFLAKGELKNE